LIPYFELTPELWIGDKYVIVVFYMINIFSVKLMLYNKVIDEQKKNKVIANSKDRMSSVIALNIELTNYYGIYKSETIAFKEALKDAKKEKRRFGEYYPFIYISTHNTLRILS
jgi:hypothetical protein